MAHMRSHASTLLLTGDRMALSWNLPCGGSTPPLAPSVPNDGPLCVARCAMLVSSMILMLVAKSKHEPKDCDYRASRHT